MHQHTDRKFKVTVPLRTEQYIKQKTDWCPHTPSMLLLLGRDFLATTSDTVGFYLPPLSAGWALGAVTNPPPDAQAETSVAT